MNRVIVISLLNQLATQLQTYDNAIRNSWLAGREGNSKQAKEIGVEANAAWREVQILKQQLKHQGFRI